MGLLSVLEADIKKAMKERDALSLDTLRMLKSVVIQKEIEKKQQLTDPEILAVLKSYQKQLLEAKENFAKGGREDLVLKTENESSIVAHYLPAELSDAELEKIVHEVVADYGLSGAADFGKAMGAAMKAVAGRASGERVGKIIRAMNG